MKHLKYILFIAILSLLAGCYPAANETFQANNSNEIPSSQSLKSSDIKVIIRSYTNYSKQSSQLREHYRYSIINYNSDYNPNYNPNLNKDKTVVVAYISAHKINGYGKNIYTYQIENSHSYPDNGDMFIGYSIDDIENQAKMFGHSTINTQFINQTTVGYVFNQSEANNINNSLPNGAPKLQQFYLTKQNSQSYSYVSNKDIQITITQYNSNFSGTQTGFYAWPPNITIIN